MQLHSCAAYLLENQQSYRELFKENKFLKSRTFLHPKSFDARTPETPGRISQVTVACDGNKWKRYTFERLELVRHTEYMMANCKILTPTERFTDVCEEGLDQ
ncbi:putative toxin-antitoxin system, toxin component [Trichinella spiralis]|uniref:putative toxin-antitoxin system, toxin component n=1 Tax=Trichinella spiralis TaxID=6334 RepID=UPI0001EFB793|nr:putative toxin-antitoxin system, toxin component [Trichinella spiralis]